MLEELTIVNEETGELLDVEVVVSEYARLKNYSVTKRRDSLDIIQKKLETCADQLTQQDIVRLAKKNRIPIDSLYTFYMVSLSPYYMDLEISKQSNKILNKLLKMVVNGHLVESYSNNKPIKTLKSLYECLDVSKASFYRAKSELEKLRIIRCLEGDDSFVILFNPIYIRCGNMNEFTFFEFESEIMEYNYLEYLFFKKKYNLSGSLRVKLGKSS